MDYKLKQYIAAFFISLYGAAITIVTLFAIGWDNKGAKSIWDKSADDWLFTIWLSIATVIVWHSVAKCVGGKKSIKLHDG